MKMETMKCPKCNNTVAEETKECPYCGYLFEEENEGVLTEEVENTEEETATNLEENEIQEEIQQEDTSTPLQSQRKKFDKNKIVVGALGVALAGSLLGNAVMYQNNQKITKQYNALQKELNKSQQEFDKAKKDNEKSEKDLSTEIANLIAKNTELETENEELKNGASKQLVDIKNAYENSDWQTVIDLSAKLHEKYNGTPEDTEAQALAQDSQAKIDEANAAKAAEEAKGYETGITYDQLARTPDDYKGKKVKFYGKVIQVIEDDTNVQIRLAVNDNYDTVILGDYSKNIVSSRVLEDDHITIYGTSASTITYKSTMGGNITVPAILIEKIDQ